MNYYDHHLRDYDADTTHLSWIEDMAYTRLLRLYYRTEMPIPADMSEACRLVRAGSSLQRRAVESVLREFFTLAYDGWHQARCDGEIAVYQNKVEHNQRVGKLGGRPRKPITQTEPEHKPEQNPPGYFREPERNPPQTPVSRPQYLIQEDKARAPDFARAGEACKAMRQAGMAAVNPSDPRLLALLDAGATVPEFGELAAEAVPKGKGFGWVLVAVEGRRRDAAKVVSLPAPQREAKPWDGAR